MVGRSFWLKIWLRRTTADCNGSACRVTHILTSFLPGKWEALTARSEDAHLRQMVAWQSAAYCRQNLSLVRGLRLKRKPLRRRSHGRPLHRWGAPVATHASAGKSCILPDGSDRVDDLRRHLWKLFATPSPTPSPAPMLTAGIRSEQPSAVVFVSLPPSLRAGVCRRLCRLRVGRPSRI